ncbi:MAG: YdcF family protein [Bacteroidota bacterium]
MSNKRRSRLIIFTIVFIFPVTLFSCRGMFYNTKACYEKNILLQPYDAIIVPGVPFEDSSWSYIMKGRVLWSVYLYQHGYTKNVIYSGSDVYSPYTEGKIMALYAEKLGVKPENIFVEPRAEHSTENVYYGCLIAKKYGFTKVALATDRFQSRTLADFLPKIKRKMHIDVKSLPMQDELMTTMPLQDIEIDYNLAHVDSFVSLVERESRLKRFWGTLGKNIKYEKEPIPEKVQSSQ